MRHPTVVLVDRGCVADRCIAGRREAANRRGSGVRRSLFKSGPGNVMGKAHHVRSGIGGGRCGGRVVAAGDHRRSRNRHGIWQRDVRRAAVFVLFDAHGSRVNRGRRVRRRMGSSPRVCELWWLAVMRDAMLVDTVKPHSAAVLAVLVFNDHRH